MPWKETTKIKQKLEFITEWRSGNFTISELCKEFGISRQTGYKYIQRYQEEGLEGLHERTRKPQRQPSKTSLDIEQKLVCHRKKHPRWGGEKIWKLLYKDFNEDEIPFIPAVNRIIIRNGLIIHKKRS